MDKIAARGSYQKVETQKAGENGGSEQSDSKLIGKSLALPPDMCAAGSMGTDRKPSSAQRTHRDQRGEEKRSGRRKVRTSMNGTKRGKSQVWS